VNCVDSVLLSSACQSSHLVQDQNAALREEVMDLRLKLEGASAVAEVTKLREQTRRLQRELDEAHQSLSQSKVCPVAAEGIHP
jgi:phage shock protein A